MAVKVIPAGGMEPERAQREARAVARLDHDAIVALFDAGEADGNRYLVSELVEGRTLAELEAAHELSDRDVLRIGLALADALAHAHERGVVHRDVKPQNVIVPDMPSSRRGAAKLTDFGVAQLAGEDALTRTGDVVGTLAYMAPEQAAGQPVDGRADLYALGLVLYEAFAGANPVSAGSPSATARRIGTRLPPLAKARPGPAAASSARRSTARSRPIRSCAATSTTCSTPAPTRSARCPTRAAGSRSTRSSARSRRSRRRSGGCWRPAAAGALAWARARRADAGARRAGRPPRRRRRGAARRAAAARRLAGRRRRRSPCC